ncbi:MAG: hypothetical protein GX552_15625 [Chloroflexi bacterium]|nr:hypothetical protein [Chloroflexota bacterium]
MKLHQPIASPTSWRRHDEFQQNSSVTEAVLALLLLVRLSQRHICRGMNSQAAENRNPLKRVGYSVVHFTFSSASLAL